MDGSYRTKRRSAIRSSGYVIHTLKAALWCVSKTTTFRDAFLLAANLSDDAETVGAVTGQIAGAAYGVSSTPEEWFTQLAWNARLADVPDRLFCASIRA